jgi:hypothetical protein
MDSSSFRRHLCRKPAGAAGTAATLADLLNFDASGLGALARQGVCKMKNRRTLAEARDELIKAQDDSVEDTELQIVREFADGRRRAIGIPAPGGIEYQSISEALWLQAIGRGWSGKGPLTLKCSPVQVDFEESSAIARSGAGFVHIREVLDPEAPPEDQAAQQQAPPTSKPQQRKNPGGRPVKYDWDQFWIWVVEIVDKDFLPKRPELMRQLYEKMSAEWDDVPAESAVRSKLSRLYAILNLPEE